MNPSSPNIVKPLTLQPLVAPLLVLALLLIGSGLFSSSLSSVLEGGLALATALVVQFQTRDSLKQKLSQFVG